MVWGRRKRGSGIGRVFYIKGVGPCGVGPGNGVDWVVVWIRLGFGFI